MTLDVIGRKKNKFAFTFFPPSSEQYTLEQSGISYNATFPNSLTRLGVKKFKLQIQPRKIPTWVTARASILREIKVRLNRASVSHTHTPAVHSYVIQSSSHGWWPYLCLHCCVCLCVYIQRPLHTAAVYTLLPLHPLFNQYCMECDDEYFSVLEKSSSY